MTHASTLVSACTSRLRRLFAFPDPVNEVSARVAGVVAPWPWPH